MFDPAQEAADYEFNARYDYVAEAFGPTAEVPDQEEEERLTELLEEERRGALTQAERDAEDAALDAFFAKAAEEKAARAAKWADAPF